ncbi:MAG: hypothetical protein WC477_06885 [Patescibacteria group bacterium]
MSKTLMAVVGVVTCLGIGFLVAAVLFISCMNTEARLRNAIVAKQRDNTSEFDNMWKKISQTAQVTDAQKEALKDIFTSHAQARTGNGGGGSVMKWVQESVPNVDLSTMKNLQNIITGSRDAWTMRQKELIDLKREHDNLIDVFPSSAVCAILGRQKIDIQVVTSGRTERSFETGKDDDVNVFEKKPE